MKFFKLLLGTWLLGLLVACGGGGGSAGENPNLGELRTSAGAAVVIPPTEARAYTITGGVAPYSVRNADPAIALGSVSGAQLAIQATGIGSTSVAVVDNRGTTVNIAVRVGSSTPVSVTAPSSLSLALGPNAAQTFEVRGGVGPYTAVSSDPRAVAVAFDPATLKLTVTGLAVGSATISVRDGANEAASFNVSTTPAQALSVAAPSSLVLAVSGTQTYKISGGVKPYQVSSSNPAVLSVTKQFEDDLVLRGVAGGTATVNISDISGAVVTLSVNVGSANALFTTAPAAVTLSASETSALFDISGGSGPYSVTSANAAIASVSRNGVGFSITAGTVAGATSIAITDTQGARIKVDVTVAVAGGGSTAPVPPASVEVLASSNTLQSAGVGVDITAYVKNSRNATMPNEPVSFTADSGLLQNASTQTDANGAATAKLLVGSDKSNRAIRITVRSGTASGFVTVNVVGTRVVLTGDAAVKRLGSATYAARVLDSAGNGIPAATVNFASTLNNTFNNNPVVTDALGLASVVYNATNAGTDKLTASALGALGEVSVTVSAIDFGFDQASAKIIPLGVAGDVVKVRYQLNGVPVVAVPVKFTITRGAVSAATVATNGAGEASVTISSDTAGPATVLAQIDGVGQASWSVNFVADTPSSIAVQANPGAIPPNSGGSSLSQSTVEAVVRDVNNNPVAGRQVNFTIQSDLSGGNLTSPTALTDLNGKAQVQYIAGTTSTAVNGVKIQASVDGVSPALSQVASLTVNSQSLFITIGLGNEISNVDSTTYSKPFSVYLTDATGNPVGSQPVTVSVIPLSYDKGTLEWNDTIKLWVYSPGSPTTVPSCPNTDTNLNGIVDGTELSPLRPGNVVVATPSVATTDAAGRAVFSLQYGEQFAKWVTVNIVARTTVSGTESVRTSAFGLTGSGEDYNKVEVAPAGAVSPFGAGGSCP